MIKMHKSKSTIFLSMLLTVVLSTSQARAEEAVLKLEKVGLVAGIKTAALLGVTNGANVINTTNKFKPLFQASLDSLKAVPKLKNNFGVVRSVETKDSAKQADQFSSSLFAKTAMARDAVMVVARPPLLPRFATSEEVDFYKNRRALVQKVLLANHQRMLFHYHQEMASLPMVAAVLERTFSPVQSDLDHLKALIQKGSIQDLDAARKMLEAGQEHNNFAQSVGESLS